MLVGISGKINSGKDTVGEIIQIITNSPHFTNEAVLSFIGKPHLNPKWEIKRFADKLKYIVCMLLGCTRKQLEDREFKEKELGKEWGRIITSDGKIHLPDDYPDLKYSKLTPRLLLQLLGTECGRQIIHPNIWVNALMSEYKTEVIPNENYGSNRTKPKNWIITKEEEDEYLLDNSHWVYKNEVNVISPNWIITDMRFPNELEAVKSKGGITIRVNRKPWINVDEYEVATGKKVERVVEHESETSLDSAIFDYVIQNDNTLEDLIQKVREILILEKII